MASDDFRNSKLKLKLVLIISAIAITHAFEESGFLNKVGKMFNTLSSQTDGSGTFFFQNAYGRVEGRYLIQTNYVYLDIIIWILFFRLWLQ